MLIIYLPVLPAGAINAVIAEVCINGTSWFEHNTGYDGGDQNGIKMEDVA